MSVVREALLAALILTEAGIARAQVDPCTNIRLPVAEQIECRGRLANALGDADRLRVQQEYEDRIRRATDALIVPPVLRGAPGATPGPGKTPAPNLAPPDAVGPAPPPLDPLGVNPAAPPPVPK